MRIFGELAETVSTPARPDPISPRRRKGLNRLGLLNRRSRSNRYHKNIDIFPSAKCRQPLITKFGIFPGDERPTDLVRPQVALILSTYQKPRHLKLVLASIALQQGVADKIELVVTDDGSTDETPRIVERFAQTVGFPVRFTTHEHRTFQLARCRNEGVSASVAPYSLFLDGDCVLPPDFVFQHLARRRPATAISGDCYRLDPATSGWR